jgi:hypothetical protein
VTNVLDQAFAKRAVGNQENADHCDVVTAFDGERLF